MIKEPKLDEVEAVKVFTKTLLTNCQNLVEEMKTEKL